MAILAMDTAGVSLSLACGMLDGRLLATWTTCMPRMHATLLHPVLDDLLASCGLDVADLEGIVVGAGPGSYTGVRIAVTAAKTLAFARKIPVVDISSLAASAYPVRTEGSLTAALFDARRGEAFMGIYRLYDSQWLPVLVEQKWSYEQATQVLHDEALRTDALSVWLTGDGAQHVRALWPTGSGEVRAHVFENTTMIRGDAVFKLGLPLIRERLSAEGEGDHAGDAHALVPRYLQLAEAEARFRLEKWGTLHDGP